MRSEVMADEESDACLPAIKQRMGAHDPYVEGEDGAYARAEMEEIEDGRDQLVGSSQGS